MKIELLYVKTKKIKIKIKKILIKYAKNFSKNFSKVKKKKFHLQTIRRIFKI